MSRKLALACAAAIASLSFVGAANANPHGPTIVVQTNADGTHRVAEVGNQRTHTSRWKRGLIRRQYDVLDTSQYDGRW